MTITIFFCMVITTKKIAYFIKYWISEQNKINIQMRYESNIFKAEDKIRFKI